MIEKFEIRDFNLKGEILKLKHIKNPKKNFIAKLRGRSIYTEDVFYNEFSKKEQDAIIYHELGHREKNLSVEFRTLFSKRFWIFFCNNKLKKLQEYEADKYSAIRNNKKDLIIALKTVDKLSKSGKIVYNFKNHPSVDERIKAIKELK